MTSEAGGGECYVYITLPGSTEPVTAGRFQIETDRAGNVQRGRLTLLQPGRIRFQYEPGNPLLIVADGRSLNMIDYEVRQVQRWPIRNSPLAVLIDPAANLVRYGRLIPGSSNDVISVEVRDPARPDA